MCRPGVKGFKGKNRALKVYAECGEAPCVLRGEIGEAGSKTIMMHPRPRFFLGYIQKTGRNR